MSIALFHGDAHFTKLVLQTYFSFPRLFFIYYLRRFDFFGFFSSSKLCVFCLWSNLWSDPWSDAWSGPWSEAWSGLVRSGPVWSNPGFVDTAFYSKFFTAVSEHFCAYVNLNRPNHCYLGMIGKIFSLCRAWVQNQVILMVVMTSELDQRPTLIRTGYGHH